MFFSYSIKNWKYVFEFLCNKENLWWHFSFQEVFNKNIFRLFLNSIKFSSVIFLFSLSLIGLISLSVITHHST